MSAPLLPDGFEDLLPWMDWCQARMDGRRDQRIESSMDEIEAFYDAVLPRLDAILAHLADAQLDGMDKPTEALMNLALALAEVAPAVEQFGEPTVSHGYDVKRFRQEPQ